MLVSIIIPLIISFAFRVRGGFGEMWGWRLPLCKWWFCTAWTIAAVYLTGNTDWRYIVCLFIGARLSTSFCGWGEAVTLALGARKKPDKNEMNELDFDEF